MSLTVLNLQRKVQLNTGGFKAFVESLHNSIDEVADGQFSVALISDRRMKELNSFFRGNDSTTDVLSFPHEPDEFVESAEIGRLSDETPPDVGTQNSYLGDIVISVEQAQKQAVENGLTLENEIKQLILHGLLHLCGYDHETDSGEMNRRELDLRRKLRI